MRFKLLMVICVVDIFVKNVMVIFVKKTGESNLKMKPRFPLNEIIKIIRAHK